MGIINNVKLIANCLFSSDTAAQILVNIFSLARHVLLILPVFCGCEICFFTLREKHRLRIFDSGVLRVIFGTEIEEVIIDWRKLHNEDLHDLYSSLNIIG